MVMRQTNATMLNDKLGKQQVEIERKKAMEILEKAESFVVITNGNGENSCISVMDAKVLPYMAFNTMKIHKEILKSMKNLMKEIIDDM